VPVSLRFSLTSLFFFIALTLLVGNRKGILLLLRLAPLRVRSATGCQQPPEWSVLGQVDCVVLDSPWESRSFCTVFIQVVRGHPGGLFQYTEGEGIQCVEILASAILPASLEGLWGMHDLQKSGLVKQKLTVVVVMLVVAIAVAIVVLVHLAKILLRFPQKSLASHIATSGTQMR